jgi:hypothetical protein
MNISVKKLLAILFSFTLFLPQITAQADSSIPEQWAPLAAPGAGYIGFEANESFFASTEASTWFNFTTSNGEENGKITNIAICNTGSEAGCDFSVFSKYRAVLPMCSSSGDINCISGITATDASGKSLAVDPASVFPKENPQAFAGNAALNVPQGSGAVLVSIPDAKHAGGDLYLVKTTLTSERSKRDQTFPAPSLSASIHAVKIIDGDFFDLATETNTAKYDSVRRIQVGTTQTKPIDHAASKLCVAASLTQCAMGYTMPKEITFGFSLRLSTNLSGWLHGRMRNAVIDYKQDGAITNLSVTGTPISVPLVDVWAKSSDLSDAHIAAYAKQHWGGEARHYPETPENMGLPIADSEKTRSGMQNISFKHVSGNFSEGSMANFLLWLPLAKDKASAMPTEWRIGTMSQNGDGKVGECLSQSKSLAGVVTTNSTMYVDGPPKFQDGFLDYKVASTHFEADGTTVFKGTYELIMSSKIARCIYGFTSAPVSATVSITSENGEPSTATTQVNEKNGWLTLAAYNFTFSSPTVRVSLSQVKEVKEVKKATISCIKGKKIKKVTAVTPKCPSGYRKK